jgi:hypothetical protein
MIGRLNGTTKTVTEHLPSKPRQDTRVALVEVRVLSNNL